MSMIQRPTRPAPQPGYLRPGQWEWELKRAVEAYGELPRPVPVYRGTSRLKAALNRRRRREQERAHAV